MGVKVRGCDMIIAIGGLRVSSCDAEQAVAGGVSLLY